MGMYEKNYREDKLLYHLTAVENFDGILENGLLPRKNLRRFTDVANSEIIECRKKYNLEQYIPFHFFIKNPFAEAVQKAHRDMKFAFIALTREYAKQNGFKILLKHPLSLSQIILYEYEEGFDKIEWDLMNKREYSDPECKHVCMAECLTDKRIYPNDFYWVIVKDEEAKNIIVKINNDRHRLNVEVNKKKFININ